MSSARTSGLLLHITSLPSRYGIGDLGPAAYRFADFLERAGQHLWQVLPLGPTGHGTSPYTTPSTFAGNPLLISPERLRRQGLLEKSDLAGLDALPPKRVAYRRVREQKTQLLTRAFECFEQAQGSIGEDALARFEKENAGWLDDYALYMALREAHGPAWTRWPKPLRTRRPEALAAARKKHERTVRRHVFWQHLFDRQWTALCTYCHQRGIQFFGDLPIYVAHHSADVWAHQDLFQLDDDGRPTAVAGVPPDYFSETGQLWGNPLYRWDVMEERGFSWWIARFRRLLNRVDLLRLDHFRGFEAYWHVPAGHDTALNGQWMPGPGTALFEATEAALGELPFVAEDLGAITPEVHALMHEIDAPGMAVLIFGLADGPSSAFLPHHHRPNRIAYTGTHDNNTLAGWYADDANPQNQRFTRRYLNLSEHPSLPDVAHAGLRATWASTADRAIAPVQDLLGLGSGARMNTPGEVGAQNWSWRLPPDAFTDGLDDRLADHLADLTVLFDREGTAETLSQ